MPEQGKRPLETRRVTGLGDRLREARERWCREHSVRGVLAFSRACGLSDSAIADYERDEVEPGVWALLRISETSGMSLDYLVKGGAPPEIPTIKQQTDRLLRLLRAQPQVSELHREQRRRYLDLLDFIGSQMRRLTVEAQKILGQFHAEALGKTFEAEEFHRRFAKSEEDTVAGREDTP